MVESVGPQGAVQVVHDVIESKKMRPEDFSIREIYEAVTSDMFPQITGELINAKVIDGYSTAATIGDQLVTTVPSKLEVETIVGFTDVDTPEIVPEAAPYNAGTIGEKYVTIRNIKYGKLMAVTEEAIMFDRTGQLLTRAQRIGEKAAYYKEQLIVEKAIDVNSDAYAVSGTPGVVFRAAASGNHKINSRTATPFGEAGLEEAYKLMHNMTDDNGDYVVINPSGLTCLIPQDLYVEALQMVQSTLVPENTDNAVNIYKGAFKVLTSPFITRNSTSTWYLGDWKQDLLWTEVWPLETQTMKPGSEDEFKKDIKAQFKIRFFGGCGYIDHKHVYRFIAV
jgi:hypothetical protein